jgi:hypothetical protein
VFILICHEITALISSPPFPIDKVEHSTKRHPTKEIHGTETDDTGEKGADSIGDRDSRGNAVRIRIFYIKKDEVKNGFGKEQRQKFFKNPRVKKHFLLPPKRILQ